MSGSNASAYLFAIGAALAVGALLVKLGNYGATELGGPGWPLLLGFLAALCFAGGAAIKAVERR